MQAHILVTPPLLLAALCAALFALAARAARLLTGSGAAAAFVVGLIVFGLGGGLFAVPLFTFFLTSSLLSQVGRARKAGAAAVAEKGSVRDAAQVLANGGAACAVVVSFHLFVHVWPVTASRMLLMLYLAALATVNADTWATEIGVMSGAQPRLVSTWKPAGAGASGAVTWAGLLASVAGSALIALSAVPGWRLDPVEIVAVSWAGIVGAFADSVLGAGCQALYRNPVTGDLTERRQADGSNTVLVRGVRWINNDVVNFLSSVIGVLSAWLMLRYGAAPFR